MADRIEEVQVLLQKRNIRSHGPMASNQINSMQAELVHDLAAISDQWNNRLTPLTEGLPDGTDDSDVDAFLYGLDGKHMYVDQRATLTLNASFFNSSANRPNTLEEQFDDVYSTLSTMREDLESEIASLIGRADQISIQDNGNLYSSENVETALQEVMTTVNNISLTGLTPDLSAVNEHYIPFLDDTYDVGSSSKRIRDLYLGPASLNILAKTADGEAPTDKDFHMSIASVSGKLQILDGSTVVAEFDSVNGAAFPAGGGVTVGGSNTHVQFNDNGDLGGSANFTWDGTNVLLGSTTGIRLGNTSTASAGMVRWDGSNFQGHTGSAWVNLDTQGGTPAGSDTQIQFNDGGSFGASANFVYDADGNLGIGAQSPSSVIRLYSQADSDARVYTGVFRNVNTGTSVESRLVVDTGATGAEGNVTLTKYGATRTDNVGGIANADAADLMFQGCSSGRIYTYGSEPLYFMTNRTLAMTVDTSQRVGIGDFSSNSVNQQLHVRKDQAGGTNICTENQNSLGCTYISAKTDAGALHFTQLGASQNVGFFGEAIAGRAIIWTGVGHTQSLTIGTSDAGDLKFGTDSVIAMTIDSSQNVGIGTTSPVNNLHTVGDIGVWKHSADADSAGYNLYKSRGTEGSPSTVQTGDNLGFITWNGWDGAGYNPGARITAIAGENFDNDPFTRGTNLVFQVVPVGSGSLTNAMSILDSGAVLVGESIGIGTSSAPSVAELEIEASSPQINLSETGGEDTYAITANNSNLYIENLSNGTSDFSIREEGYVRIGKSIAIGGSGEDPAQGEIAILQQASPAGPQQSGWGTIHAGTDDKIYYTPYGGSAVDLTSQGSPPAGSDTQIQFNSSGSFGASSGLTYSYPILTVSGGATSNYPQIRFDGGNLGSGGNAPRIETSVEGLGIWIRSGDYTGYTKPSFSLRSASATDSRAVVDFEGTEYFRMESSGSLWLRAVTAPGAADTGFGAIYMDTSDSKLYWHPNGGSAVDLTVQGVTPGGSDGQVQYNNGGSFGGDANFTWNDTNGTLNVKSAGSLATPLVLTCTSSTTSVAGQALQLIHETTGNMVDGFGAQLEFRIKDGGSGPWTLAYMRAIRDGTDNTGTFQIDTVSGGTATRAIEITPTQNVGIGNFALSSSVDPEGRLNVIEAGGPLDVYLDCYSTTEGHKPNIWFRTSDSNNLIPLGATESGRNLGSLIFQGVAGGTRYNAAQLLVLQDGTPAGAIPGAFVFYTSSTTSALQEAMRITSDGRVGIGTSDPVGEFEVEGTGTVSASCRAYGASGYGGTFSGYRAGGTQSVPSATTSGMVIMQTGGGGHTGSDWTVPKAIMRVTADENWDGSNQGCHIEFHTTAIGSTTRTSRMQIADDGNVGIGSDDPDELLTLFSSTEAKVKLNTSHESNYSELNFYRSEGGVETFGDRIDDNDILGKISFTARWDDEVEVAGEYESSAIICQATEDWTTLNGGGSELLFNVTEADTTSQITAMLIHDDGDIDVASGLKIGGAATAEAGRLQWTGTNFQGHDGSSWKNLDVAGGAPSYTITTSKTGTYNANAGEVVRCDPSGGGFTVNLPTASGVEGETVIVKNTTSSTNTITISRSGSDTIDGATTKTISVGYGSITFVSYGGTAWGII